MAYIWDAVKDTGQAAAQGIAQGVGSAVQFGQHLAKAPVRAATNAVMYASPKGGRVYNTAQQMQNRASTGLNTAVSAVQKGIDYAHDYYGKQMTWQDNPALRNARVVGEYVVPTIASMGIGGALPAVSKAQGIQNALRAADFGRRVLFDPFSSLGKQNQIYRNGIARAGSYMANTGTGRRIAQYAGNLSRHQADTPVGQRISSGVQAIANSKYTSPVRRYVSQHARSGNVMDIAGTAISTGAPITDIAQGYTVPQPGDSDSVRKLKAFSQHYLPWAGVLFKPSQAANLAYRKFAKPGAGIGEAGTYYALQHFDDSRVDIKNVMRGAGRWLLSPRDIDIKIPQAKALMAGGSKDAFMRQHWPSRFLTRAFGLVPTMAGYSGNAGETPTAILNAGRRALDDSSRVAENVTGLPGAGMILNRRRAYPISYKSVYDRGALYKEYK